MYLQMGHIVVTTIQGERTIEGESQNQNESEKYDLRSAPCSTVMRSSWRSILCYGGWISKFKALHRRFARCQVKWKTTTTQCLRIWKIWLKKHPVVSCSSGDCWHDPGFNGMHATHCYLWMPHTIKQICYIEEILWFGNFRIDCSNNCWHVGKKTVETVKDPGLQ